MSYYRLCVLEGGPDHGLLLLHSYPLPDRLIHERTLSAYVRGVGVRPGQPMVYFYGGELDEQPNRWDYEETRDAHIVVFDALLDVFENRADFLAATLRWLASDGYLIRAHRDGLEVVRPEGTPADVWPIGGVA